MLRIALAQHDFLVGDIAGNLARCRRVIAEARQAGADLLLFPELALTGYPPEDLLLRPGFLEQARQALTDLLPEVHGIDVVVGHPWREGEDCFNMASWLRNGRVIGQYAKQLLPNYAVFDERRYFTPGSDPLVVECKGVPLGLVICEDCWQAGPIAQAAAAGARLVLVPNASPYRDDKHVDRLDMFRQRWSESGLPMVYCNTVGGQDELVFDGRSMLMDASGEITATGPLCEETLLLADFDPGSGAFSSPDWPAPPQDPMEEIYTVLVRGLRDYVRKNGFSDVVFGLSGGIDSSLTLALAVDALGADHVHTVMMPSRHTSDLSLELARQQAEDLGVDHRCISIEPAFEALEASLRESFDGRQADVTEENLQARIRGNIVMALSNKFGWLPLATSNKSELAVGYCTIYGDMCGGFAPILDCLKMRVYGLSRYRNSLSPAIPPGVIERPPSAELRPDQSDQDSLPPYEILDDILVRYVEQDWSVDDIVADGFDRDTVQRVARLVLINEYKRRQAAPGVRVTHRAFGRDRRYPITSGWRDKASAGD
jgi:NAD+ synthase (glutamine-hydrolysing)